MFAEILLKKAPFPKDGEAFDADNLYPLDFSADKGLVLTIFEGKLLDEDPHY